MREKKNPALEAAIGAIHAARPSSSHGLDNWPGWLIYLVLVAVNALFLLVLALVL